MKIPKLVKLWLVCLAIPFFVSVTSNIYIETQIPEYEGNTSIIHTINKGANNAVALLWMPIYIPYKAVEYIWLNLDFIMNQIEKLVIWIVFDIIVPIGRWINDKLHYIFVDVLLNAIIIPLGRWIFDTLHYIFVDVLLNAIIVPLVRWIFDTLYYIIVDVIINAIIVPLGRWIFDAIQSSLYNIWLVLQWFWNLFLDYIVYPFGNRLYNIYIACYNAFWGSCNYIYDIAATYSYIIWSSLVATKDAAIKSFYSTLNAIHKIFF